MSYSIMSDNDIKAAIRSGEIKIFIEDGTGADLSLNDKKTDDYVWNSIQPGSIDLHLRNTVRIITADTISVAHLHNGKVDDYSESKDNKGTVLRLEPEELIIGTTKEKIVLPVDIAGIVFPRSSYLRMGISINSAYICPGHGYPAESEEKSEQNQGQSDSPQIANNNAEDEEQSERKQGQSIPLQIVNNNKLASVEIPLNEAICQLVLFRMASPASRPYTGRYQYESLAQEADFGGEQIK